MNLINYWQERTSKEKWMLSLGAGVLLIGLGYHFIWSPITEQINTTQASIIKDQQLLSWMKVNEGKVRQSRGVKPTKSTIPMFQLVEKAFSPLEEDEPPRISRLDDNRVSVVFNKVAFDKFFKALENLTTQNQLVVSNFSASKADEEGYASINITLSSQ